MKQKLNLTEVIDVLMYLVILYGVPSCISSIMSPKALAPNRTGISPNRRVRESGKVRVAVVMTCISLSLPSGGVSSGQSIATVKTAVTTTVRRMSRYLRILSV